MSTPASILQSVQADQSAKADAWEAFNSAQSEADLTPKMMNLKIPQEAKAQLWELKRSMGAQKGTPITDRTTIGPQSAPQSSDPMQRLLSQVGLSQGQIAQKSQDIQGLDQQGRAEHPILAGTGDVLRNINALLMGGQSAGQPMGTSSGVLNNPVTQAMAQGPGIANLASGVEQGIGNLPNLMQRMLRGPTGAEPVSINPTTIATRELEAKVAMGEPSGARGEMSKDMLARAKEYEANLNEAQAARQKELADAEKLRNQHAESLMNRGKQQNGLEQAHAQRLNDEVVARQKEVAAIEQLRQQHAAALNARGGSPSVIAMPGQSGEISGAQAVNRTLVSYERPHLLQMVKDPSVPYQTKVMAIAELRRNPGSIPKEVIDSISKFMVEPGAPTRIYGGPGSER